MAVAGYAHGIQTSFLATMNTRASAARQAKAADPIQTVSITPAATAATKTAQASSDDTSFLDNVLDVINPLQHLPVVGTLYRAITGDKIGDVAQVAGDTLYGGIVGLGASVANLVFKDATGKDFGDTVLAFAEDATGIHLGDAQPTALADAKPEPASNPATAQARPVTLATTAPVPQGQPAITATQTPASKPASVIPAQATMLNDPAGFMAALQAKGIDPTLGMRAMQAYQKTLGITQP